MSQAEIFPEDSFYASRNNRTRGPFGPWFSECGPWSANHTGSTKSNVNPDNFRPMMRILTIILFIICDTSKLQSCWKSL